MADEYYRPLFGILVSGQPFNSTYLIAGSSNLALETEKMQEMVRVIIHTHRRCIKGRTRVVFEEEYSCWPGQLGRQEVAQPQLALFGPSLEGMIWLIHEV